MGLMFDGWVRNHMETRRREKERGEKGEGRSEN
jgi:hypothetical protein